jgi:hypothetical protein
MVIFGVLLILFGFLCCLTIVGAILGIPLMLVGVVCVAVGGRRRTVIQNVVHVTNAPDYRPAQPSMAPPSPAVMPQTLAPQVLAEASRRPMLQNAANTEQCPSCNAPNDPGGRFCNNCGIRLAPDMR